MMTQSGTIEDSKVGPDLLVVAGEASGDLHGARVLAQVRRRLPGLRAFGLGGQGMGEEGFECLADPSALNVVGLSEALRGIPRALALRKTLLAQVRVRRPAAALLIDLPGFNLNLAAHLKRLGVPVVYYVAPQAWAWRRGRVRKIRKRVDRLCVIFPFEQAFFSKYGIPTRFVGHPLMEACDAGVFVSPFAPPVVALVPGSRAREVERLLPALAGAARILAAEDPSLRFKLPLAPGMDPQAVRAELAAAGIEAELTRGGASEALRGARLALVCSGTATLEAALAGVPMLVVYRVSRTTYALGKALARVDHMCIVNLLAGRRLVPELLQSAVEPASIAAQARTLLADGQERERVLAGMRAVVDSLRGPCASVGVAQVLLETMGREAA